MTPPDDIVKSTQRILNKQRIAFTGLLPGQLIRDTAAFDCYADHFTESIMTRLTAYVLTEQLVDERQTVEMAVPATWWQHFKRDYMPFWFKNRYPVRYEAYTKEVTFVAKATYPSSNYALPEEKFGKPVIFESFEQTPWWINDRH